MKPGPALATVTPPAEVPAPWRTLHAAAPQLATTMVAYVAQCAVSMRPSTARAIDTDLRIFAGFLIDHIPPSPAWPTSSAATSKRSALAVGPARHLRTAQAGHVPPAPGPVAHVLPAHHRVGLGRRPAAGAHLLRRRPQARRAAAPVLGRRPLHQVHAGPGRRAGDPPAGGHRGAGPHRHAGGRAVRPGGRRGDPHRRRSLAAGAPRQAAQRPLRAPASPPRRAPRALPGHLRPTRPRRAAVGRAGTAQPLRRPALDYRHRPPSRVGHVHPHQLRHTLAPPAVNRGMSIEAIAALLGHRSLDMTLRYARISNRVVAYEYDAVSAKVEALHRDSALPADAEEPNMRPLREQVHHRLLGNGWCRRPAALDCHFESICESCAHFATDATFTPVLLRQRDHAAANRQEARAAMFDRLLAAVEQNQ